MKTRSLVHLLLVLLLLFTQQGLVAHAVVHAANHATDRANVQGGPGQGSGGTSKSGVLADTLCEQCFAHAQMGGAMGLAPASLPPFDGVDAGFRFQAEDQHFPRPIRPFQSRAPPPPEVVLT